MIKRITKITSLLVCAASIISIIPAMAADAKRYDAEEGTIHNAKAKGSGIYIDGEINKKEEDVYFMTPDGKYNDLDGVDTGVALDDILLGRYMVMDDGDTVLDLKDNYKVVDGKTKEDLKDDVATTAKKVLKRDNDGRFDDDEFKSVKTGVSFSIGGTGLSPYTYKLKKPFTIGDTTIKDSDTVYIDYTGNYVDVDYNLGNIKVCTTTSGGAYVNIKNTEDTYEVKEDDNITYEYKAVIKHSKNVTDVGNYVYRWAELSIYKKVKDADDSTYTNVTADVGFGTKGYSDFVEGGATSIPVLQKFSKPSNSDEDIDGIKYPKESTVYFIADKDGAGETILGKSASESASEVGVTYNSANDKTKITGNDKGFCSIYLSYDESKVYAQNLSLKSKNGFNYIDLGDYDSTNTDLTDGIYATGGLAYVLDGGYIKAWNGDEGFDKVYKVDGAMDHLSIGNKDFMILWNEDDELYTIINNTTATAAATTTSAVTTTSAGVTTDASVKIDSITGWVQDANGTWSYNKADGTKATGWLKDDDKWYYLKVDGTMATGWVQDGSTWYYCDESGAMLTNTTVDGYALGTNGTWIE